MERYFVLFCVLMNKCVDNFTELHLELISWHSSGAV